MDSTAVPMNYHSVYKIINKYLPKDTVIVNEGANTMDIGRTMLPNHLPRHRYQSTHDLSMTRTPHESMSCSHGSKLSGTLG